MSAHPNTAELKALSDTTTKAAQTVLFNSARLEEKNKQAAKEQLLWIQLLLAQRPVK